MNRLSIALLALAGGSASAAETDALFASEQQAVRAAADLGPAWRDQIAAPRDFEMTVATSRSMALVRQASKKRRFFYAGGRAMDLEWDREGSLDRVELYDPSCWEGKRKDAFTVLLRHMRGDPDKLPILIGVARHVFDANQLRGFSVAVAPQRTIHVGRTSKKYGCRIELRREAQWSI